MDITDTSSQREQLGIERFVSGEGSLSFEGVVFWKDRGGFLVVESFSEFVYPESSSLSEAAQKIARSKEILVALSARNPAFKRVAESLPHKYEFCHSDGKSGVKLAWLKDNEVVWCA